MYLEIKTRIMSLKKILKFSTASLFLFSLLVLAPNDASAQYKRNKSSITGSKFRANKRTKKRVPKNYLNSIKVLTTAGAGSYYGDLCDSKECFKFRPSFGAGLQYRYSEHFAFRGGLFYQKLYGTDTGGSNSGRNLHFRSGNVEMKFDATYDIFPYNKMYRRRHVISPYVFAGIGLLYYNPKAEYNGEWHALRPLNTEGAEYSYITLTIPYGLGARIKVNPSIDVMGEVGYRQIFTDYLDDVSNTYNDANYSLSNSDIGYILTDRRGEVNSSSYLNGGKRGSTDGNDGYISYSIGIEYTIGVPHQRNSINSHKSRMRVNKSIKKRR